MTCRLFCVLAVPLLCLAGCTSSPARSTHAAGRSAHVTTIQGDLPALAAGLSVTEIRQKLGEPAEIKPLPSAEGTAETWVYYLEKYLGQTQVVSYMNRPILSGTFGNDPMAGVPDPVYAMADRKLAVTLRLLIFNGRLITVATQSEEIVDY